MIEKDRFDSQSADRRKSTLLMFILLIAVLIFAPGGEAVADPEAKTVMPAGQTFRDCPDCPEMVVIPAGSIAIGSSDADTERDLESMPQDETAIDKQSLVMEHPQHSVTIGRSFALAKFLVTRGEFAAFVRETGYSINSKCTVLVDHRYQERAEAGWQNSGFSQTDRDPVVCISWQDAKAYVAWLNGKLRDRSLMAGNGSYRLPSEAEWEYAARAGTQTARWWGDSIGSGNANCDGCGSRWDRKQTSPVDSFRANPFGLHDMLGNAWEWMEDCWNESYAGAPADGSAWMAGNCERRVMRGGGFANRPWVLRSAHRSKFAPNRSSNYIGLRVAKMLP
ncbi:formylglycine-generating enzyme family protein [Telmatospirillum siberiense]|uniref:formylglycine-generating enzyme family protein n=1 Tax=Telmatospirillum siberiense TaxID=382514 RepID=UPI0013040159|nr:formylglycine-generating enzyme family protein [Telmatospirillum siberiense]